MPDELPLPIFITVVVLQLAVAGALIVLLVRLRRAVKAQGLSMNPKVLFQRRKKGPGGGGS